MNDQIDIFAFWACRDIKKSEEYFLGREEVLKAYGFDSVVEADRSWMTNERVFVINAYRNNEIVAGMKIHIEEDAVNLPFYSSIKTQCPGLLEILESIGQGEYCEIGGVWNSKNFSGLSFSHILARYSLALCYSLKVRNVFTFNASYTYKLSYNYGAKLLEKIGKKGWFNYPTPKYKAAVWVFYDLPNCKSFNSFDQERIEFLRENNSCRNQLEKEIPNMSISYHAKL